MATINSSGSVGSTSRINPQIVFGTPARVLMSLALLVSLLAVVFNVVSAQGTPESDPTVDLTGTPEASATPSADMPRVELELEEVNESDLGGIVTLYEAGDSTIVEFAATGAGGDHPAMIVPGVCGETTDTTGFALESVTNTGESTTTIDVPLEDLLDEDHVVEILMSTDDADTVIACANIEGEPTTDVAATPEASPAATPSAATPEASPEAAADDLEGVGGGNDIDGTGGASDPTALTLKVNLVDWSETGITGTAVLTEDGSATNVQVNLTGEGITGGHELHIHNGTCASPGTATYTLNPIAANGSSTSTVNLSIEQLTTGSYFINVHPDEANWDDWMVCGNITGQATSLTEPQPTAVVTGSTSDGSTGGNTTMVTTNAQAGAFPETVGVGDGLVWPSDTRTAVIWSIAGSAIALAGVGLLIRNGERSGKPPRFSRLGL